MADSIKEDSAQAIKELKQMGIHTVMLTGDNERTAMSVGDQAGVDEIISEILPDGKEEVVRKLSEYGKTTMVGDGINDAPALTRADTGIAIGAGTDVAIDAANIVLMKGSLLDVAGAIRLSKAVLRNIHQNLFWAFIYNIIGIPIAAGVFIKPFGLELSPMFGAAAMSLSSFFVVTNALRLNLLKISDGSKDRPAKDAINKELLYDYKRSLNEERKEENMSKKTVNIEGMMCAHCEATVKKALEAIDAVEEAVVSHEKGTAVVSLKEDIEDDVLKNAVEAKDYKVISIE